MFRATGAIVLFWMIILNTLTSFNRVYAQQTRTWVGGTGIWETASNWNPPGVPALSDTAVIITGVVTMTSNQTIGGFRLNGKFISDATLTVTGKMQWFKSTQEGSGTTVINSGAVLEIAGNDFKELIGHTIDNQGTIIWKNDGFIKLHNQAKIFNRAGAIFEIQNDELLDFILPDSGGTFYNYGTLIKSGGSGTTVMDALFYNSGSIVVNSGELRFERGSDTPSSGSMNTAAGGEIEFAKTRFRLDGVTFGGSGLVQVSDGSLEIGSSGITVQNGVRMAISDSDGYLQGDGPITVNGIFDFARGKIAGNGSFTVNNLLELTGSSTRTLIDRTITNNGSIVYTGSGTLRMQNNAQIINTAGSNFDLQSDANIDYLDPDGGKIFNYGNIQKSAGSGSTLIDVELINEGGITVNSGTVKLTRGGSATSCSNTIAAGSRLALDDEDFLLSNVTFGGSGTVEFSTNSVTISSGGATILSPTTLEFPGGTVRGSGDLTIEGTFDWSRGALSGSGDVIVNGLLKITGSNYKELIERTLINNSTVTWSNGDIKLRDQAKILNQNGSLFDVKTDNLMDFVLADDGGSFVNKGLLTKTAGSGTATIDPVFHNTGTVEVLSGTLRFERGSTSSSSTGHFLTQPGTILVLSERTFIIDGAHFEGAGLIHVTDAILEVTGAGLQMSSDATIKLDDPDGKIQGTGPLTIDGRLEWLQGTINGSGNFVINNTLVLGGSHFKELAGRTITNNGSTIVNGSGSLRFSNNAVFNNTSGAVFEFQAAAPFIKVLPDGGTFNNHGTLRKASGSGDSQLGIDLVNDSTIEVQSGATLSIASGGRLIFPQGTVSGAGTLNILGSMLWSGGTVSGSGQLTNHGLIELSGSGLKTLDTRTLVNYDSLHWLGSGNFGLKNNALIDTRAGSKLFVESSGTVSFLSPNGGSISNGGTILRPNSGTAHFAVNVSNSGTVEARNGTLDFNAAFSNLTGANLKGSGVLDFSGATFSNSGNTSPGSSLGKLTFQGNYVQNSGSALNIEIGGHLPGVNYDKLAVNGSAALGGQLNIELENLYVPAIGDTFRVLSYGSRSGQFDEIIMPVVSGQPAFALSYLNDGLILTAVAENLPPVAVDDVASTPEDTPVSVNVLLNDTAQNTGSIFLNGFSQPAHGSVVQVGDSTLKYTPAPNYNGSDGFFYAIRNANNLSDTAQVSITVQPVNDPPVVVNPIANVSYPEDSGIHVVVSDLDSVFADTDGTPLSYSAVSGNSFIPVTLNNNALSVGSVPDYHGSATVTVTADDGNGSTVQDVFTVTITPVNDPPLLVNPIANQNFLEDSGPQTVVSDLNSVFGDPDPGTVLSFSAGSDNPEIQASIQGTSLVVSASADYFGSGTISVNASDGGPSPATDQFTVTVEPVNDAPVIADLSTGFSMAEDDTLYIALDSLVSDIDDDIATLNWHVFLPGSGAGDSLFLALDSTTHLLALIPAPDMTVSGREIRFTVSDPGDSSDTALSWVSVIPVNDAPVFTGLPDSLGFAADSSVTLALWDYVSDPETADSLLNFLFEVSNSSLESSFDSTNGLLTLSAKPGFSGSASLGITVSDPQHAAASDSIAVTVSPAVGIEVLVGAQQPLQYALEQNYPNPFNPETVIKFQLPAAGRVTLAVYNILGQKVRTLVNEHREAGFYEAVWNGRDERGGQLASGVYIYHLRAGGYQQVRKMVLLK